MRILLAAALLAATATVFGQAPVRYDVRIEAPRELRELLAARLPLARWRDDPQMSAELLERLVAEAADDVRRAVATRGYFSPRVATRIVRTDDPWTVVITIDPGTPARVTRAELGFSGPASADPDASPLLQRIRRDWRLQPGRALHPGSLGRGKARRRARARRLALRRGARRPQPRRGRSRPRTKRSSKSISRAARCSATAKSRCAAPSAIARPWSPSSARRAAASSTSARRSTLRAAPACDRLLRQRAGRAHRGASAGRRRAGARGGDRGALAERRDRRSPSTPTPACAARLRYRNLDIFDTAWRFKSEVQLDSRIRQGRLDLDSPPRAGGRWNSVFTQARESTSSRTRRTASSRPASRTTGASAGRRLPCSSPATSRSSAWSATSPTTATRCIFGYRTQWRDTDTLVVAAARLHRGVLGRRRARLPRLAALRPRHRPHPLLRSGGRTTTCCCAARPAWCRPPPAKASHRPSSSAPAATRRSAVTPSRAWAWRRRRGHRRPLPRARPAPSTRTGSARTGVSRDSSTRATRGTGERFEPAVGTGAGVRLRTPIGPVRADLAYGVAEKSWRLHLSVGFLF